MRNSMTVDVIVILNTMLARDQTWNPPACANP
jgi:hypothetical protein